MTDLALAEFEKKAEERAISIVSTRLFDAGLIDKLLVNGAVDPSGTAPGSTASSQGPRAPAAIWTRRPTSSAA